MIIQRKLSVEAIQEYLQNRGFTLHSVAEGSHNFWQAPDCQILIEVPLRNTLSKLLETVEELAANEKREMLDVYNDICG